MGKLHSWLAVILRAAHSPALILCAQLTSFKFTAEIFRFLDCIAHISYYWI